MESIGLNCCLHGEQQLTSDRETGKAREMWRKELILGMPNKQIEGKLGTTTSVTRFFCEIEPYLSVTCNTNRFTDHI